MLVSGTTALVLQKKWRMNAASLQLLLVARRCSSNRVLTSSIGNNMVVL